MATYVTQFRAHESGIRRNVVGRVFSGLGFEAYGADPSRRYLLALECIGMGGVNAVDIAEQTHIGILAKQKHKAPHHEGLLEWCSAFPTGDLLQGIYIDDGATIGVLILPIWISRGPTVCWLMPA